MLGGRADDYGYSVVFTHMRINEGHRGLQCYGSFYAVLGDQISQGLRADLIILPYPVATRE
jgi:hypothetical protein